MTDITHPKLVAALVKPGADILATLDAQNTDLLHMVVGVAGEAGEILECYERYIHAPLDRENMVEELGDFEFYLEGVRQNLGIARRETVGVSDLPEHSLDVVVIAVVTRSLMLLDRTKKLVVYNKQVTRDAFVESLKWIEVWLEQLRVVTGITRDEVLAANIAKLAVRYEGLSYTDQAAQARADKTPGD